MRVVAVNTHFFVVPHRFWQTLFLCLVSVVAFAQNEADNWYFGDKAGFNFSRGNFSVVHDGVMETPAGCSVISDKDGNLLFYTNGTTIWNKNHLIMEEGEGLVANINAAQQVIIVPNPANENIYYVFTIRDLAYSSTSPIYPGVYFSEVTFSATHPLGIVSQQNSLLRNYAQPRMAAYYDYDSSTSYVLIYGTDDGSRTGVPNKFYVYKVSSTGVSFLSDFTMPEDTISYGQMKISPNGKWIALADYDDRYVYLCRFRQSPVAVEYYGRINMDNFGTPRFPYGVEFSPDSVYLYAGVSYATGTSGAILRYKVELGDTEDSDVVSLGGGIVQGTVPGALQLASNGKIYVAITKTGNERGSALMGVINRPTRTNVQETNFVAQDINVAPAYSRIGLPSFVSSFFRNRIVTEDVCIGDTSSFEVQAYAPQTSVSWDFDDGNTLTALTADHTFSSEGVYTVQATITVHNQPLTLYKQVKVHALPVLPAGLVLKQCDIENTGFSVFNLDNVHDKLPSAEELQLTYYTTEADALAQQNPIAFPLAYHNRSNPEQIFVRIVNRYGCENVDSFYIQAEHKILGPFNTIYACDGGNEIHGDGLARFSLYAIRADVSRQIGVEDQSRIKFYLSHENALTKQLALTGVIIELPTTRLWLRLDDENSDCEGIGYIDIVVNDALKIVLNDEYYLCNNTAQPPLLLDGGIENSAWQWQKSPRAEIISSQRLFAVTEPGTYTLTVQRIQNGKVCDNKKMFTVIGPGSVAFENVIVGNSSIQVTVTGSSSYQFSLDNVNFEGSGTSHFFNNLATGIYTIYVRDLQLCEAPIQKTIGIVAFDTFFTPNGDGINDTWRLKKTENFFKEIYISIFDRYGQLLYTMNNDYNKNLGWDGTFNGEKMPATDYWFTAVLVDEYNVVYNRQGHFSLVR